MHWAFSSQAAGIIGGFLAGHYLSCVLGGFLAGRYLSCVLGCSLAGRLCKRLVTGIPFKLISSATRRRFVPACSFAIRIYL
jgi:hypothetical protein